MYRNADYQERVQLLGLLDELLRTSGVEAEFIEFCLRGFLARATPGTIPSPQALERQRKHAPVVLRTMVLRSLLQETFRGLSVQLAQAPLLRKFSLCDDFGAVHVPSKSGLQRFSQWLSHEEMRAVIDRLTRAAFSLEPGAGAAVGLEFTLDLDVLFLDSTCLPANIHFPVDWVLYRDAVRSLMKAVAWTRSHGLVHRMDAPGAFLSRINALCMEMAQVSKFFVADSKDKRKAVLRKMKKVVITVARHARRYRELLHREWEATGVSRGRVDAVLGRMDNILSQLPAAIKQAHERIIGERQIPNAEKILSLYEPDIHVMVRGKASGEVEFGNSLLICEQSDGFMVDYELTREAPKADAKCLQGSVLQVLKLECGSGFAVVTDRSFDGQENREFLAEHDLFNGLCPRDPKELQRRTADDELFGACQKRRAQTEARIATLKNVFIGQCCRAKGFASRQAQVDWAVLTHNLRLLVRIRQQQEAAKLERLKAAA